MLKQLEILFGSKDVDASCPLSDDELSRVRAALQPGEHAGCYVRGRIVGAGAGLWVLSQQRLFRVHAGRSRQVEAMPLTDIESLSLQAGRYGSTVVMRTASQRFSLFAADAKLAQDFVAAASGHLPPASLAPAAG